ncbi:MAG TPA: pyridoxamine 5'-phosphate oxidase family protein [Actinoallomurus sp.]|jgi:nitroimidazol reductase NimA-like FMN-containing flavoprotein (pyridoxamine 5'-phosphate oxidase superfamily)
MRELAGVARDVIADNVYLSLGTADASGDPWVSPVYYTAHGHTDFYWVSSPDALHSRNIARRPQVSMAIYDSHSPVGGAEAVYMTALAAQVADEDLTDAAAIYNGRLPEAKRFELGELLSPALLRLYRATVTEHSVLIRGGDPDYGRGADSRMTVFLR